MEILGVGMFSLALVGLLVYYIRKGVNSERNTDALEVQSRAQVAALDREEGLLAEKEREDRRNEEREKANIGGDRERANQLLIDATKDNLN